MESHLGRLEISYRTYLNGRIEMLYTLLIGLVVGFAGLGALLIIGAVVLRARSNKRANQPELDSAQVDEITSTWTLLN
jgi:hypothetical protein